MRTDHALAVQVTTHRKGALKAEVVIGWVRTLADWISIGVTNNNDLTVAELVLDSRGDLVKRLASRVLE